MLIILFFGYLSKKPVNYKPPANSNVAGYINFIIKNYNLLDENDETEYIPVVSLTAQNGSALSSKLGDIIKQKFKINNANVFNFVTGELLDNINEHSNSSRNYILAQYFDKLGLEICIYDNGIGIPGSFEKSHIDFSSDPEAIEMALEGISTKNMPGHDVERGAGLSTINKIMLKNDTEFILASGTGIYYSLGEEKRFYKVPVPCKMNGTFISIIFKNREKFNGINLYDYT